MSGQNPEFPEQDVLHAQPQIAKMMENMHLTIPDCPGRMSFVLGDTPLPPRGISEVATVNRVQWENSLHVVIGPDPNVLSALVTQAAQLYSVHVKARTIGRVKTEIAVFPATV